ncbi:MAG: KOW domain-containing protein [Christensenellales bacterium]|jgi:ribosomal protein L14E/L6E/L27E
MTFNIGDIVCSTAGRDIGKKYIVWNVDGKMLFLVNGRERKINNPKKKKTIHVAFYSKSEALIENLKQNKKINDAYLRKILN